LPALFVDGRNRGCRQFQIVGDKHHGLLLLFNPDLDSAQERFLADLLLSG
jgi:hypothetical protein